MRNLYSKSEFLNLREQGELLTEGSFVGKMFGKFWNYLKGIKGGEDVKKIYNKYVKIINDEFKSKGKTIQLDYADSKPVENKPKQQGNNQNVEKQTASYSFDGDYSINEAGIVGAAKGAVKGAVAGAKAGFKGNQPNQNTGNQPNQNTGNKNQPIGNKPAQAQTNQPAQNQDKTKFDKAEHDNLIKIVNLHKNQAQKEMNAVLKKYGGNEGNPKLAASIAAFMYNFDVALTRAELKAYPNEPQIKTRLAQQEKEYNQKVTAISKGTTQDASVIEVDGKKIKLNTPYQYNNGGNSKTIVVTNKSDDPKKVTAKYISDKLGLTVEQPFRVNLIKTDFVPAKNQKYKYYSNKQNAIIDVEVLTDPDKRGLVKVRTDKGNIMVHTGALMNLKKEKQPEQKTKTVQAAPAQPAKPAQTPVQPVKPATKPAPKTAPTAPAKTAPAKTTVKPR